MNIFALLYFLAAMPIVFILAWLIRRIKFRSTSLLQVWAATLVTFTVLFVFFVAGPFVGTKRYETVPMRWSILERNEDFPEEDHIVFSVVERPEQQIGFYSTEMSEYLRTKGGNPIDVTFEITSDYGRARAFNAMKIGDLILWIDSKNPLPSGPA